MIAGITVNLINETVTTATDAFGAPVYTITTTPVENVLVAPASVDDITSSVELYGKKAIYTIAIPKGDTHTWEDQVVEFFGHQWRVFGYPEEGIEANIPLAWNQKWKVERYG